MADFMVGIIGAGPSGLYVAERLLKRLPNVHVNLVESRFCPFGLIRYGVAPDQVDVKNITNRFKNLLSNPRIKFFGGIAAGKDVTLHQLHLCHNALVFCTGAAEPRRLNIPGTNSANFITSAEFTGWYNSDPQISQRNFDFKHIKNPVIIGNGNVALDVARILLKPSALFRSTDISFDAQRSLDLGGDRNVTIFARRGPLEASFSVKELKDLVRSSDRMEIDSSLIEAARCQLAHLPPEKRRIKSRLIDLFGTFDDVGSSERSGRHCRFAFFKEPVSASVDELGNTCSVSFRDTRTNVPTVQPADLVISCIGYYPGSNTIDLPKNCDGTFQTDQGRISSQRFGPCYAAGWCATGAKGALAQTYVDSCMVADSVIKDGLRSVEQAPSKKDCFSTLLRSLDRPFISSDDWRLLDELEQYFGSRVGQLRTKIPNMKAATILIQHIKRGSLP